MPKVVRAVIDLTPPTAAWRKAMPRAEALVRKMATAALTRTVKKSPRTAFEISVVLTTDAAVRRLNRLYRDKDKPTNVLSFPADAPAGTAGLLGDVVIAYGVTAREAKAEGKALNAHLAHLVVHGVLHLLGYDHAKEKDAVAMERLESDIMARMGFADPYAILAPTPKKRPRPTSKPARKRRAS